MDPDDLDLNHLTPSWKWGDQYTYPLGDNNFYGDTFSAMYSNYSPADWFPKQVNLGKVFTASHLIDDWPTNHLDLMVRLISEDRVQLAGQKPPAHEDQLLGPLPVSDYIFTTTDMVAATALSKAGVPVDIETHLGGPMSFEFTVPYDLICHLNDPKKVLSIAASIDLDHAVKKALHGFNRELFTLGRVATTDGLEASVDKHKSLVMPYQVRIKAHAVPKQPKQHREIWVTGEAPGSWADEIPVALHEVKCSGAKVSHKVKLIDWAFGYTLARIELLES